MSAEATIAVINHATGTDAEKWTLGVLANYAGFDGLVSMSIGEIAERTGKSERAAAQVLRGLKKSGQLIVIEPGSGRGHKSIYWLNLPGFKTPPKKLQELVMDDDERGPNGGPDDAPPHPGSKPEKKKSSSSKEAVFVEALRDADVSGEMMADARALLRKGKKVGGQLVTPEELACATAGLAAFNALYEWDGRNGGGFGIGAAVTSIVQRARERPSWDPATHVRLVESAWRLRWWEKSDQPRRPTPNVIWGPKAFEQVVQDAEDEKAGRKSGERRYTRRSR